MKNTVTKEITKPACQMIYTSSPSGSTSKQANSARMKRETAFSRSVAKIETNAIQTDAITKPQKKRVPTFETV